MPSRTDIFEHLQKTLHELFEIPLEEIKEDALLYEDLELDSIDAVDLIVKIKEYTGKRVEPQIFKEVKTISDVITAIEALLAE